MSRFSFVLWPSIIIILDQVTKWWAGRWGLVQINYGTAFGWGQEYGEWLVAGGLLLLTCLIFFFYYRHHQTSGFQLGWGLILSGGLSNLIDRLIWGGVRDFLPMIWWRNNLADIAIGLGVVLSVIQIYRVYIITKNHYV